MNNAHTAHVKSLRHAVRCLAQNLADIHSHNILQPDTFLFHRYRPTFIARSDKVAQFRRKILKKKIAVWTNPIQSPSNDSDRSQVNSFEDYSTICFIEPYERLIDMQQVIIYCKRPRNPSCSSFGDIFEVF